MTGNGWSDRLKREKICPSVRRLAGRERWIAFALAACGGASPTAWLDFVAFDLSCSDTLLMSA